MSDVTTYNTIKDVVEIILIPIFMWVVKKLGDMDKKLNDVNTTLVGADGKNGLRSRFRRMERKVEALSLAFAAQTGIAASDTHEHEDEED